MSLFVVVGSHCHEGVWGVESVALLFSAALIYKHSAGRFVSPLMDRPGREGGSWEWGRRKEEGRGVCRAW